MKTQIKTRYKILLFAAILFYILFLYQAFALDTSEFGSFQERSTIMKALNQAPKLSQEQKDLLKEKKLAPTTECLVKQIKKGNTENVKLLLDSKVNPNESYYTDYPIYIAAKENNLNIVVMLYDYGAKLDKGFYSELFEAVKNKNIEMAQYLLDRNARVNYQDSITQETILYYAIKNNMLDIASQLIQKGARADRKSVILLKKKKLQALIEDK